MVTNPLLRRLTSLQVIALTALRLVIGLMILEYGLAKLFNFPASISGGEPLPPLIVASGVIELLGGIALTTGIFTRLAAFIVSGEMAVVYFDYFAPRGPWPSSNGGDLAITWCFALIYIAIAGGGAGQLGPIIFRILRRAPDRSSSSA